LLQPAEIEEVIKKNLDCIFLKIKGDDGTHFDATIVSESFINQSTLQQHQLVYKSLGDMMKQEIHALSIKTYTPVQWKIIMEQGIK
jgi:acid stress-induced BolA-like protein IbaG/YrbA|tara:strand:- start:285 stop:542 length:258 start_codon:yes stop_codon:yes gene_type:complete